MTSPNKQIKKARPTHPCAVKEKAIDAAQFQAVMQTVAEERLAAFLGQIRIPKMLASLTRVLSRTKRRFANSTCPVRTHRVSRLLNDLARSDLRCEPSFAA
jgi:hypothetical protein